MTKRTTPSTSAQGYPSSGRFVNDDPYWKMQILYQRDPQGLNLYVYCINNPVNRIDSSGLDSYIFYSPVKGDLEKAKLYKAELIEKYGTAVHLIEVADKDAFVTGWNEMGTQKGFSGEIEAVLVAFHGGTDGIGFQDKKEVWSGGFGTSNSDLGLLDQKTIGVFVGLGCNLGTPVQGNQNFVEALMDSQKEIGIAIASHGYVTTSQEGFFNKYVQIATSVEAPPYGDAATGYRVFTRDGNGNVISRAIGDVNTKYKRSSQFNQSCEREKMMGIIWRYKNRFLIISLSILFIFIGRLLYSEYEKREQLRERKTIFQYIGKSSFDSSYFRTKSAMFTWWEQVQSEKNLIEKFENEDIIFSGDVDFSDNYLIMSYGREILDMGYAYLQPNNRSPFLIVTFADQHDGNTVFFYKTEKISFAPCFIITYCYIMKGEEKIFVGKSIYDMMSIN